MDNVSSRFGNIYLFIPLGFVLPILFRRCQEMKLAVAMCFAATFMIELIQGITHWGSADIDDVILRTVGGALGYTAWISAARSVNYINKQWLIKKKRLT
jgi:glycopeptide antibiotics resistance protein